MSSTRPFCRMVSPDHALSARRRDLIEIVAPRQYTIGFVRVITEKDDDLGRGAHAAVELDADRYPHRLARLDARGRALRGSKRLQQRLGVDAWPVALRQHGVDLLRCD